MDNNVFSLATGQQIDTTPPAPQAKQGRRVAADPKRTGPDLTPPDDSTPLSDLRRRAGLSDASAAELCGVSLATWRRWLRNKARVPIAVRRLLTLYAGEVPSINKEWRGFLFRGERLHAPNGESVTAGEVEHFGILRQQEVATTNRMRELEFWATLNGRSEQVRLARAFGAIDIAAYVLGELYHVVNDSDSQAVKLSASELKPLIDRLFNIEDRMSQAANITDSR